MIYEKNSVIIFDGKAGEKFNVLAERPNKETMRKRDLFFKEIDKLMEDVIIDGDTVSFEVEKCE